MRSRIFWSLVAFAATPLTVILVFSNDGWVMAAAIAGLLSAFVGALLASAVLMAPVLALQRRLRVKNYGQDGGALGAMERGDFFGKIVVSR